MTRAAALGEACQEWQRRLRLSDWRVVVTLASRADLGGKVADVCWSIASKRATIRILEPDEDGDWETSLVHELLHLHLAPLGVVDNTPEDTAQEQAIELIAEALVALRRD